LAEPSPNPAAAATRPEHELLLCCARTRMDAERASRIRVLVGKGLDWAYLLRTAPPHGMMPLLYWHLKAICPESVPKAILDHLRDHFSRNLQNNLLLTGELLKLLERLEAHGIRAIPYKGPVLAASVYGNLSLRQFRDLDLLVHGGDLPRARDLLISMGYRPDVHLSGAREAAFLHSHCVIPFARDSGRVIVELHWGITPRYFSLPLDPGPLWERLGSASLAGKAVPNLSPEDLLVIFCAHGCLHLWERLEWICGVAELIRAHPVLNWRQVMEQAGTLGAARMVALGLLLAGDLLGTPVPGEVVRGAQGDPVAKSLAAQVRDRLCRGVARPSGLVERCFFHLRARERLKDKVRYCLRIGTTPTDGDWALLPLPAFLSFLYYLLRPMRLVGKYGLRPLKTQLGLAMAQVTRGHTRPRGAARPVHRN